MIMIMIEIVVKAHARWELKEPPTTGITTLLAHLEVALWSSDQYTWTRLVGGLSAVEIPLIVVAT